MIRVLCLNPVIDKVYNIGNFQAGKKFKEMIPEIYIGGKGVNIARVINCLDEECVLYAFIGGNAGKLVYDEMKRLDVESKLVEIFGETRTTVNIIDEVTGQETEITELGSKVSPPQRDDLIDSLVSDIEADDIVVCSGISIKGVEESIYKIISDECYKRQAKCIIDTNNDYLKQSLPGNYYFAKPNENEVKEFFNLDRYTEITQDYTIELCRKLMRNGIKNILLTMGEKGGILINDNQVTSFVPPRIDKVSTIGSGDSTVAGLCVGLVRNMEMNDCIKLALACGTSNAAFKEIGYVTKESVDYFFDRIEIVDID